MLLLYYCPSLQFLSYTDADVFTRIFNAFLSSVRCLEYFKSDPTFAEKVRHTHDPKARIAVVWNHCKSKMICEMDEPKEDGEGAENVEEPKKGHGGCGFQQPQIRKEGLKLFVQYKKPKDDDEVCLFFSAE